MDARSVWESLDPAGPPVVRWLRPPDGPEPAVLLGAFDPPTRAHLDMIVGAARLLGRPGAFCLTKVLLDRPKAALLTPAQRLEVLDELAADAGLGLAAANRGTYLDVARALDGQAVFVVGSDKLAQLRDPSFYADGHLGADETFRRVRFCVIPRSGLGVDEAGVKVLDPEAVFDDPGVARISGSDVRGRLAEGMSVDELVPPLVARRLERYNLDTSRRR